MSSSKRATFLCERCNRPFEQWIYRKPRFCSRECANQWNKEHGVPRDTCPICGKRFLARKREDGKKQQYCSRKCSGKAREYPPITLTCEQCNQAFTIAGQEIVDYKKRGRKFCSQECHYASMEGENNPFWINGDGHHDYGPNWKAQREKARKRDNYTCQRCRIHETEEPRKLDVHHIIPIENFGDEYRKANALSNLITLCRSCHLSVHYNSDVSI